MTTQQLQQMTDSQLQSLVRSAEFVGDDDLAAAIYDEAGLRGADI